MSAFVRQHQVQHAAKFVLAPCNATAISFDSGKSSSTRSIGLSSNASATDSNPSKNNSDAFRHSPLASAICSQNTPHYRRPWPVRSVSRMPEPPPPQSKSTPEFFSPNNLTARGISRTRLLRPSSGDLDTASNLYVSEGLPHQFLHSMNVNSVAAASFRIRTQPSLCRNVLSSSSSSVLQKSILKIRVASACSGQFRLGLHLLRKQRDALGKYFSAMLVPSFPRFPVIDFRKFTSVSFPPTCHRHKIVDRQLIAPVLKLRHDSITSRSASRARELPAPRRRGSSSFALRQQRLFILFTNAFRRTD